MKDKEILGCSTLWNEVAFFQEGIACCSCPEGAEFDSYVYNTNPDQKFYIEEHIAYLNKLYEINSTKQNNCKNCRRANYVLPQEIKKFSIITIINSYICNLKCSYCNIEQKKMKYDVFPLLKSLVAQDLLTDGVLFQWGGGEPTIRPDFRDVFSYIHYELNKTQLVNTNAVHFSQILYDVLPSNKIQVITSIDAGTSETYKILRGADVYNKVCEHISKYISANPEKIRLKYIICEENTNEENLYGFTNLCKNIGLQKAIISLSLNNYYNRKISNKMRKAKSILEKELNDNNIATECIIWDQEKQPKKSELKENILKFLKLNSNKKEKRYYK